MTGRKHNHTTGSSDCGLEVFSCFSLTKGNRFSTNMSLLFHKRQNFSFLVLSCLIRRVWQSRNTECLGTFGGEWQNGPQREHTARNCNRYNECSAPSDSVTTAWADIYLARLPLLIAVRNLQGPKSHCRQTTETHDATKAETHERLLSAISTKSIGRGTGRSHKNAPLGIGPQVLSPSTRGRNQGLGCVLHPELRIAHHTHRGCSFLKWVVLQARFKAGQP